MIGLKSISAIAIAALLVGIGAAKGALGATYLAHQSALSWLAVALVATLALGLVGIGWRFDVRSRAALALRRTGPVVVEGRAPRELPGAIQRVLVLAGFASIALAGLGNHAAARMIELRTELAKPSPSTYCLPHEAAAPAAQAPEAPPVDQAGCALVKRAFALGYAKSLGSCAPTTIIPVAAAPVAKPEVCTRRQLDEPYLHYAFRRIAGAAAAATSVDPLDAAEHRIDDVRAHLDYLDGLLADVHHAITGSPHAAHHLWVSLPDPHPGKLSERFTGAPRCSQRYADLPLWPRWRDDQRAELVEHVLGQLLFATRFGSTASCSDYTIHWDAPPDACAKLVADPQGFLDRDGALTSVRAVLDRRRRQIQIGELEQLLGRTPPPAPPPVQAVISLQCLAIDHAGSPTAATVKLDGDELTVRDLHVAAVRTTADGPIDVYLALAALLAGTDVPRARQAPPAAPAPAGEDFALTRLDPLADADPFSGARWPLERPELVDVFPFERHLHAFVDAFRRRYLAQRGRL